MIYTHITREQHYTSAFLDLWDDGSDPSEIIVEKEPLIYIKIAIMVKMKKLDYSISAL